VSSFNKRMSVHCLLNWMRDIWYPLSWDVLSLPYHPSSTIVWSHHYTVTSCSHPYDPSCRTLYQLLTVAVFNLYVCNTATIVVDCCVVVYIVCICSIVCSVYIYKRYDFTSSCRMFQLFTYSVVIIDLIFCTSIVVACRLNT